MTQNPFMTTEMFLQLILEKESLPNKMFSHQNLEIPISTDSHTIGQVVGGSHVKNPDRYRSIKIIHVQSLLHEKQKPAFPS